MAYSKADKLQQVNIDLRREISGEKAPDVKKAQSYLILDSEILPEIKDWKVGNNYKVEILIKQLALNQQDNIGPLEYDRTKMMAKFEVIKVNEAEEL